MKKLILILSILTAVSFSSAFADDITVKLNGSKLTFDQPPVIQDGRTLVPMRAIFEALNCTVEWNGDIKEITAISDNSTIKLTIDKKEALIDSEEYTLDVPPQIINDRTLVPVRFIAESLKCKVDWHEDTSSVVINRIYEPLSDEPYNSNLYNPSGNTQGKYMTQSSYAAPNEYYFHTSAIDVSETKNVYFTINRLPENVRFVTAFDENMNVLPDLGKENVSEFNTEGVAYIVVTALSPQADKLVISTDNEADIFLPEEICVADGKTITIYNDNIISKNTADYTFNWECEIGTAYDDRFSVKAMLSNIGTYDLKLTVTNSSGDVIYTGKTVLKTVLNNLKNTSILAIGDAFTNNKPWLETIISSSGRRINFIGTRGVPPRSHEARSTFTAKSYLSATEYTYENEGIHPFWDGERFNWNHYKKTTNLNPHAIQIFLSASTLNGDPTIDGDNIKSMVDYIRNDDPDIPIFVVNMLHRGVTYKDDGTPNTETVTKQHTSVFNQAEYLTKIFNEYDNVYMIPAYALHDTVNNFSSKSSIYPNSSGYDQLADIIYSTYCAHLG